MTLLVGSIQLGLLYGVLALGIYITFRILQLPDLTVDGSFSLGMAVAAVMTVAGHPVLALLIAILSGALAGLITGLLQTKLAIHPILSGILVMTGLYTVNLFVMGGRANLPLMGSTTIFLSSKTGVALVLALTLIVLLSLFFKTRFGLAIRATGDNEDMVRSSSINADFMKCAGLMLGNACVGLSGALIAQYQMFSDVGSGSGMVVIGLASVIIGETIFGKRGVTIGLASAVGGSILYRIIIALALRVELFPSYALKLISALIVVVALSGPSVRRSMEQLRVRRSVKEHQRKVDEDAAAASNK
jgi:putative ABC transport system permease protein